MEARHRIGQSPLTGETRQVRENGSDRKKDREPCLKAGLMLLL